MTKEPTGSIIYRIRALNCHTACVEIDNIVRVTRGEAPRFPNRGQVHCALCQTTLRMHPNFDRRYAFLFTYALDHAKQHREGTAPSLEEIGRMTKVNARARLREGYPDDD